jgi:hypothetical protein
MRAHTKGKHEMGKRFAIVIGVAAAGVMALGAQTATSAGPVDSTPPDLQLSGPKKQNPFSGHRARELKGAPVVVKVSCGDEACIASAEGEVKNEILRPWNHGEGTTLEPGETELAVLKLDHRTQPKARKALENGKKVKAKVTVEAEDAAGNVATAKRTIKLVKGSSPGEPRAAQTAAAPDVVKYDTELTIAEGSRGRLYHGRVLSQPEVRKCMEGRRVVLIKQRPGADRKLGTSRSQWGDGEGHWRVVIPQTGARVYVKVRPKVSDRFVCRADRSETI